MTWEELCEKAKEMGCSTYLKFDKHEVLRHNTTGFLFCKDGDCYMSGSLIHNRTHEQMYQIMEALR